MKNRLILIITTILFLNSCENESVDKYIYGNLTGKVTDITTTLAVSAASITTSPGTSITSTNTEGEFSINNLQEGQYSIIIEKDGYVKNLSNIYIMPGKTTNIEVTLETKSDSYGTITGLVKDGNGDAIPNIQISTTPGTSSVFSDADGKYTLSNIPTGDYIVTAKNNSSYLENSAAISVKKGEETTASFIMEYDSINNIAPAYPQNPTPAHNITSVSISQSLSWECSDPNENDTLLYDIYLWADGSTFTRIAKDVSTTSYNFSSTLSSATVYYWFIVAKDPHDGVSVGQVWKFTTS